MWIISYRWNGKAYIEEYKTYKAAQMSLNSLEQQGYHPSIHFKEITNETAKTI